MELLRTYCLGDKPIHIQVISDQKENFGHSKFPVVNFQDGNFNIAYPIFSIHGNHDDPSGEGGLSAMDLLHVCNLVNYFGKAREVDNITVNPILIQKGPNIKIALYGIGNVRDERLHRTFMYKKIDFIRPEDPQEWFNVLVLHQNRVPHGETNHIKQTMLPEWLDLVVWGHEHECRIIPEPTDCFSITQPGSSVATSLSEGESVRKYVGILEIMKSPDNDMAFRIVPIKLKSVRPFKILDLSLSTLKTSPDDQQAIADFLSEKVEELLHEINMSEDANSLLPLIRLRVDYSGYTMINAPRFGQKFVGRVANPNDIILWQRKRQVVRKQTPSSDNLNNSTRLESVIDSNLVEPIDINNIDDLIGSYINDDIVDTLELIPETGISNAIKKFVSKNETDTLKSFIKDTISKTRTFLMTQDRSRTIDEGTLKGMMSQYSRFTSNRLGVVNESTSLQTEPSHTSPSQNFGNNKRMSSVDALAKIDQEVGNSIVLDFEPKEVKKRKKLQDISPSKKIKIKEDPLKNLSNM